MSHLHLLNIETLVQTLKVFENVHRKNLNGVFEFSQGDVGFRVLVTHMHAKDKCSIKRIHLEIRKIKLIERVF